MEIITSITKINIVIYKLNTRQVKITYENKMYIKVYLLTRNLTILVRAKYLLI